MVESKKLQDILVSDVGERYFDVLVVADDAAFQITHQGVVTVTRDLSKGFVSVIPDSFRGLVVDSVRSDGETLMVRTSGGRMFSFGFSIDTERGETCESLEFFESPEEIAEMSQHFESMAPV